MATGHYILNTTNNSLATGGYPIVYYKDTKHGIFNESGQSVALIELGSSTEEIDFVRAERVNAKILTKGYGSYGIGLTDGIGALSTGKYTLKREGLEGDEDYNFTIYYFAHTLSKFK